MLNNPVLILNQNYEPLNVCRVRRAIILILNGKAEVLENNSATVRSATMSMISPSVVRLGRMVKRPRTPSRLTRRKVFIRDKYTCQYCGKQISELTLDHVMPRHRGGEHIWGNVVSACKACNQRKAGNTPIEAGMKLLRKPLHPSGWGPYLVHPLQTPPEWREYLAYGGQLSS